MTARENWLTIEDPKKFCVETMRRYHAREKRLKSSGQHASAQACWRANYRKDKGGAALEFAGPKGEIVSLTPSVFRRGIQERRSLVDRIPQDVEGIAKNTDAESQAQSRLAVGLIKHYRTQCHLDALGMDTYEQALVCAEAYMHVPWDPSKGEERMADSSGTGAVREGDFEFSQLSLYDVAHERTGKKKRRPGWWIVRERENRFDAIARWPEAEEALLKAPPYSECMKDWDYDGAMRTSEDSDLDDDVAIFYVYGEKSASVPDGVQAIVLDEQTLLEAPAALDYDTCPVFGLVLSRVMFTDDAYSDHFGALEIAQARGAEISTIMSNHKGWGLMRGGIPRKANASKAAVSHGLSLFDYDHVDPDNPQGAALPPPSSWLLPGPTTSAELFAGAALLAKLQDDVQGGSPVQRGDTEATKNDSGAKVAALFSASQQVAATDVRAFFGWRRELYNHVLKTLQAKATTERVVMIAGIANEYTATVYTAEKLRPIDRIDLRDPDPARDSFTGRMATAEVLKGAKDEQERQMLRAIMSTGNVETVTGGPEDARIRIEREHELLRDLTQDPPVALETDPHPEEIAKHRIAMSSDSVRRDPEKVARHKQHIAEHVNFITPDHPSFIGLPYCAAFGIEPLPPHSMPAAADAAQKQAGKPAGGAQGAAGKPPSAGGAGSNSELPEGGSKPGQPGMPKDPTTGARMQGAPPPPAMTGGS